MPWVGAPGSGDPARRARGAGLRFIAILAVLMVLLVLFLSLHH